MAGRAEPLYWAASEAEADMNLRANARKAAGILPHVSIARRSVVQSKAHLDRITQAGLRLAEVASATQAGLPDQ
ncbi:MAG: hypothetical protein A3D65_02665 [Candidatus Lloydbacteria bacterium RIFCSPHIGHO2_02_FULL_50_13]|uniref:Uncharacterized protein n=1 Tax=Candidatus Lloydbacteria bacterium RIFCSPHIGHO2_02_FULL_50_13 TaxID=1798661 RepID=A0A1G2D3L0_9BACT|nr:MAG: hypothetical protein A3D65_02665 [Candidatus Lloydbacteria bacterium RIFCSPHIGHO2_02_FULL_50_13]